MPFTSPRVSIGSIACTTKPKFISIRKKALTHWPLSLPVPLIHSTELSSTPCIHLVHSHLLLYASTLSPIGRILAFLVIFSTQSKNYLFWEVFLSILRQYYFLPPLYSWNCTSSIDLSMFMIISLSWCLCSH